MVVIFLPSLGDFQNVGLGMSTKSKIEHWPFRQSIDRILCPINLTQESGEAVLYAAALANAFGAKLYVCHCVELGRAVNDEIRSLYYIKQLLNERLKIAETIPDLEWEGLILEGEPAQAIVAEAGRRRINLIVMRSRRRPYAAALLGSTAEAISRTAPCPVLVTHPDENETVEQGNVLLEKILVGYDFSEYSDLALSYAFFLAEVYNSEIHILHVTPQSPDRAWYPLPPQSYSQALRKLKMVVSEESRGGVRLEHAVTEGVPYREILLYAEERGMDMICMGSRGAGFGFKALFGSNIDRVLRQAPCPILISRPLKWTEAE